ncbi:MAG: hypothetical protein V6S10_08720 [Candidatus Methanoglobus sp.]
MTYREILDQLLDHACAKGITSFKRLKAEKYRELREKYPNLPIKSTQPVRWPAISTGASGGTGE